MSLRKLDRSAFEQILHTYVRPSKPIDTFEQLVGRTKQLDSVEEAINSPGKHIFIYGDRGAGKTSLAQTIAHKHHTSASSPIFSACGAKTTFSSIIADIASQLVGRSMLNAKESSLAVTGSLGSALSANASFKVSERPIEHIDLNKAAALLSEGAARRGHRCLVIIDEFENLPSTEDRALFAELVKQLSDRSIPITLIFCGIGRSLEDLLQGHASAHRYLHEVKLPTPPLNFGQTWEIVDGVAGRLGLTINDDSRLRIAQVSDGFPHYVHLLCEKLFWQAFRADGPVDEITPDDYMHGVTAALENVEARLRLAYDKAVKKQVDEYQEVLWAVADHYELERNTAAIYTNSYERIMNDLGRTPVTRRTFTTRLNALKTPAHGSVLTSARRNWVQFSENLIRGYVRLVAEGAGVRLALEHEPAPPPKTLTVGARRLGIDPAAPRRNYGSWGKGHSR